MNNLICSKFVIARKSLLLSQKQLGDHIGSVQNAISGIEMGHNKYVPDAYLEFLAKSGINLSALFNPEVTEADFKDICSGKKQLMLPAHFPNVPCPICPEKDKEILMVKDSLRRADQYIDLLSKQIARQNDSEVEKGEIIFPKIS